MKKWFLHISLLGMFVFSVTCGTDNKKGSAENEEKQPDTLHVATLYGPTSYFNYRGQEMGFDYENVKRFAADAGYILDLKVAPNLHSLINMVAAGDVELAAYPIPVIEEYNKLVKHCGYKEVTWQVLVQPDGKDKITDVTQLVGKTVYVEKDSKYHFRLNNLDKELGGGINIIPINKDSLITEDLIRMVELGEIPLTVVDSDIAELNKSYYPRLDIDMKISLDQYSSWAVGYDLDSLAVHIDTWEKRRDNSDIMKEIYKKYFEISKNPAPYDDPVKSLGLNIKKGGRISPYDGSFKKHAPISGYDWRLLAAIGFNESRFDNDIISWAGAQGVMQIMPITAKALGIDSSDLSNADSNILAAAKLLKKLDTSLADKVPDADERLRFVIAAYNCGLGHIFDSMALAEKYGLDSTKWLGNVSEAALMKSRPQYYNDPVVKNGYFRGRETTEFVDKVMSVYSYFMSS